jgi:hypothetical protein
MVARSIGRMLGGLGRWQVGRLLASGALALTLTILVGVAEARTALAAAQIVTSSADSGPGSLREVIASAASGDAIYFEIPPEDDGCFSSDCVITLTSGQLSIDKDLAIYGPGPGVLRIERSDESSTTAFRIFWIGPNRTVTLSGLWIENGFVVGGNSGAGIFNAGTLTLANSVVIRNLAEGSLDSSGGGIANAGTMTLSHSFVIENTATGVGGGIASAGRLTISNSNIWWNETLDGGRGGGLMFAADTTVSNSLFLENVARSDDSDIPGGGAIYGQSGTLRLENSTISGNRSNNNGGGLISDGSASVVVSNVTFNNNHATPAGARTIARLGSSTVTVRNSIVVKAAEAPAGQSCGSGITLAGNNISDDGSCGMPTGVPLLGPLQDNGGFTQSHALQTGSAAVDAGDATGCKDHAGQALTTDVRGAPRPQGSRCDLGAFELQVGAPGSAAPFILANARIMTREDAGATPKIDVLTYDSDVASGEGLQVTATSNSNDLLLDDGISVVRVNSSNTVRTLSVMPRPDANGPAIITLTVTDRNGQTASTEVTVSVSPVNDVSTFVSGPVQVAVLEDGGAYSQAWATSITSGPADESVQTVTFDVTNNAASLFSVAPAISANGTLTFTPAANAEGKATVLVVLRDSGGTANGGVDRTASRQFEVSVTPVNDRPSFVKGPNVTVQPNSGKFSQDNWAQSILAGPPNESTQSVSFQAVADRPELFTGPAPLVGISATGTLTFTPAPGVTGTATVSVVLQDVGGTANGGLDASPSTTFTITIASPNKPPTAKDDSFVVAFNMALNVSAPGVLANDADPEGATLKAIRVKLPTHGTLNLAENGSFSYTPTPGYSGPDSFTYKANDGASDSEAVVVSLTVGGPPPCAPRPNPSVQSVRIGTGRLSVTVAARASAQLPTNGLTRLVFGAARNARVEAVGAPAPVSGPPGGTTPAFTLDLPAGTRQTTFILQRAAPGEFMVELVVLDGCETAAGPFKTFVGGGTGVQ